MGVQLVVHHKAVQCRPLADHPHHGRHKYRHHRDIGHILFVRLQEVHHRLHIQRFLVVVLAIQPCAHDKGHHGKKQWYIAQLPAVLAVAGHFFVVIPHHRGSTSLCG